MKKRRKKDATLICVICGSKKKSDKKVKCCGRDMVAEEKVWPD